MKSTKIDVQSGADYLNEIVADQIKAAGALISFLDLKEGLKSVRMIPLAKEVLCNIMIESKESFVKEIQSYSEFQHLKRLTFFNTVQIAQAILERSQLEIFVCRKEVILAILPKLALQTQLKEVEISLADELDQSDVETLIGYLPNNVEILTFQVNQQHFEKVLVLLLKCTINHVQLYCEQVQEEILNSYFDSNQQLKGKRTRKVNDQKFQVSANNEILNLN